MIAHTDQVQVVVVRARERLCAIRISQVEETMRPLPIASIVGAPPYVLGVSMIRGLATPVVDLGSVLAQAGPARLTRFLTLKNGGLRVALGVDQLVGTQFLNQANLRPLPAHLQASAGERIEAVGSFDEQLLFMIEPARLLPESLWASPSLEAK